MIYRNFVKPASDRLLAAFGLLILSPVLLVLFILIRIRMGSPVIFSQTRIGLNNAPFLFRKFRTMTSQTDSNGNLLPDEVRLTAFGRFLRSSSLDELPQLWNVLRGDMSLIGPRPLLPEYLPRYSARQIRRHEVKPGITGWAQVKGRNEVEWAERFNLDVWYIDNQGLGLDLRILWMTFLAVVQKKGISQKGQATMSAFLGDSES